MKRVLLCTALAVLVAPSLGGSREARQGSPPRSFTWAYTTGAPILSSVKVGDVTGDGRSDLVITTYGQGPNPYQEGYVHIVAADGEPVPGWPVHTPACIPASAAIGDLDGDGSTEIVVGDWSALHVFRNDGTSYPGWPKPGTTYQSCCLEDLTGDGDLEIVHPQDTRLYVYRHDGSVLPGWPYVSVHSITAPSVADIDGDGQLEIVAGTYQGPVGPDPFEVYAWELDGTVMAGFPFVTSGVVKNSPAVADLEGDGTVEIVAAAYDTSGLDYLYVIDDTGALKPGWPVRAAAIRLSSAALGDLDADGRLDVVIGGGDGSTVYSFRAEGIPLDGWPVSLGLGLQINSGPVVADIDSLVPGPEVIVKTENAICALHGDGTAVSGFPKPLSDQGHTGTTSPAPAVEDTDGDGLSELIAASCYDSVVLWETWGHTSTFPWWPTYRRDPRNTGTFPFLPSGIAAIQIDAMGLGIRLSWQQALLATSYAVYRGTTAFFPPDQAHILVEGWVALFLIDPGASGNPSVNYYYVVVPRNAWGSGPVSDRVGEFDWTAVARRPMQSR